MMTVPYLADEQIDGAAHELLMKFSRKMGVIVKPPVPVDDIIEKYLGVSLEISDLKTKLRANDVLGAAYFDEGIIRLDESLMEQEGRLCFTMAHEVGHWQLHRPLYEMNKVSTPIFGTREQPPAFLCRSKQKPPAEYQADAFAARLLMPGRFVREAFREVHGDGPFLIEGLKARRGDMSVIGPWSEVARAVISKGGFTNVSLEAMRYRLDGLSLVCDLQATMVQPCLF